MSVMEDGHAEDEVKNYMNARYISASEALWKIYGFPIHEKHPPVDMHIRQSAVEGPLSKERRSSEAHQRQASLLVYIKGKGSTSLPRIDLWAMRD